MRVPAFGIAILTPVVLAGAVAAAPDRPAAPAPIAEASAPVPAPAPARPAATRIQLTPPNDGLRIPATALSAYHKAEQTMAGADPDCGLSWNLLAGIGRIESSPASGATAIRTVQTRTTGPTKMPSASWSRFAADGDGDGKRDPRNPFDAALATARNLCSSGMNFRNQSQALTALLRYNNSMAFAQNVMGWAAAYASGTAPLNLPPIYGPVPVLGPYLPGSVWSMPLAAPTQAGYLLPVAAAENPVLPAQSAEPPPVIAALPEPEPLVATPAPVVSPVLAAEAVAGRTAVTPQIVAQGGRRDEPTADFSPPPPPAPAPQAPAPQMPEPQLTVPDLPAPEPPAQIANDVGGRQAGRGAVQSPVQSPVQASGSDDTGGGKSSGSRRGQRGAG